MHLRRDVGIRARSTRRRRHWESLGPSMGPGIDGETRWYTERQYPGSLFRVRWEHGGLWLERFRQDGTWEDDFGLYDFFNGHEMGAVEITREQAEELEQARGSGAHAPPE